MGKKPKAPSVPVYDIQKGREGQEWAAQKTADQARYGMESAGGNIKWTPQGYVVEDAPQTERMRELQTELLGGIQTDPTQASQSYYDAVMGIQQPQIERQREAELIRMQNQGIPVGGEAYNKAIGDFDLQRNLSQNMLASEAMGKGQQYVGGQLQNLGQLGGQILTGDPTQRYMSGIGGYQYESPYDTSFGAQMQSANMKNQQYGQQQQGKSGMFGTLGGLGGSLLGAAGSAGGFGKLFSDINLKENLDFVGKLNNGLNVYLGNYKPETGLDTTPQLFLIAQEVEEIKPDAVGEKDGFKTVDYKEAVKNGNK